VRNFRTSIINVILEVSGDRNRPKDLEKAVARLWNSVDKKRREREEEVMIKTLFQLSLVHFFILKNFMIFGSVKLQAITNPSTQTTRPHSGTIPLIVLVC
jgi:hypothetical protein